MNNILLVDDHTIVRDGLSFYFEDNSNYVIKYQASNGQEALDVLEEHSDDISIIITDLSMPHVDGVALVRQIKERDYPQKVIVLTMINEIHYIKELIALKVNGYLLKNSTQREILSAVDEVVNGENFFSKEVTTALMDHIAGKPQPKERLTFETPLSRREKEVLKLIVNESSNQEIADALFISSRTVESHKRNLLDKTGAKNVAGLVMYAVERNII